MRAKIITCDGKRIVSKYSQITPIGKDVYAAFISKSASGNSENDIYSIVFAIDKVFSVSAMYRAASSTTRNAAQSSSRAEKGGARESGKRRRTMPIFRCFTSVYSSCWARTLRRSCRHGKTRCASVRNATPGTADAIRLSTM